MKHENPRGLLPSPSFTLSCHPPKRKQQNNVPSLLPYPPPDPFRPGLFSVSFRLPSKPRTKAVLFSATDFSGVEKTPSRFAISMARTFPLHCVCMFYSSSTLLIEIFTG